MRTTFLVACLAVIAAVFGQADVLGQGKGKGGGGGGGRERGGGQPSAPSVRGGGGARVESGAKVDRGARIDSGARTRVDGGARVDSGARIESGARSDTENRARIDASDRARAVPGRAQADADARIGGGANSHARVDTRVIERFTTVDRFGRQGARLWLPDYGWTWGYGPRYGYWDGIGWGNGPWDRLGYWDPYVYPGYAYVEPYYDRQPMVVSRPALGITMDEQDRMVFVRTVMRDSPAEHAGLQPGDVIIAINGELIRSAQQVQQIVAQHRPGDELNIETDRNGREARTAAVLEAHNRVF